MKKELVLLLGYAANVRSLDIEAMSLTEILNDVSIVIGFIEWHRDERNAKTERHYHGGWLVRFASVLEWLAGNDSVASQYRQVAASLNPERVRDPFPKRLIEYSELVLAAICVSRDAVLQWRQAFQHGRPGHLMLAAIALRDALCFSLL